jgi:predicted metalloprotease with PDZ domain
VYKVDFRATLDPDTGLANASITIDQPRPLVRGIELTMPPEQYKNIRPASQIETNGDTVTWRPQKKGSVLRYDFVIDRKRDNGLADARITPTWALLKLDRLFPPASARVVKGASSDSTLQITVPEGWGVETPYGRGAGTTMDASNPDRLFDRPLGWMIAGKLGSRSDTVGGRTVRVASPLDSGLKANDMVAFLLWTLPSMIEILPTFPDYLLIVSGTTDMWRGGLSGFHSLYVHAERPMISGNRTSTLLHELFHVGSRLSGTGGADWIVEGLAEYYSLSVLYRSGGISEYRYNEALEDMAKWTAGIECKATDRSTTKQNARAALVMRALDKEIRAATGDKKSLDDIVRALVRAQEPVTNSEFRALATGLIGKPARALASCP